MNATRETIALQVNARGNYRLPYHRIEFILPPGEDRRIDARGDCWTGADGRWHVAVS